MVTRRTSGNFYVNLAVVVVIVGIILWYLATREESPAPQAASTSPAAGAPGTSAVQATPAYVPTPAPAMLTVAPPPAAPAQLSSSCDLIPPIAQRAHVTVISCVVQNGWTIATVQGYDRNDLLNFLDELQRSGMKDLSPQQALRQLMDIHNRVVYQNTYRIKF